MVSTGTSPRVVAIPVPATKQAIYVAARIQPAIKTLLPNLIWEVCPDFRAADSDSGQRPPRRLRPDVVHLLSEQN
jgi:hypothetical protein